MNSEKHTEKIKLWGIVQGVGFRPFVAKMAADMDIKGEVLNIGGLVEITVTDTPSRIDNFIERIKSEKPAHSEIVHITRTLVNLREFDGFDIIKSDTGDDEASMIPADLAICDNCLEELYDPANKRYLHPFISCMVCGPRFTIIDRFPYDRDNTSMIDFPMCDFCEDEYTNINNRRFHAQTISCHDCGPKLYWLDTNKIKNYSKFSSDACIGKFNLTNPANAESAHSSVTDYLRLPAKDPSSTLDIAAIALQEGKVIAFKSVGGYNLVADPLNSSAVKKLRAIKHRESKPFAVMFRSIDEIKQFCYVNETEEKLLCSSARPIILLEHKLDSSDFINICESYTSRTDAAYAHDAYSHSDQTVNASNSAGSYRSGFLRKRPISDSDLDDLRKSRFIGSFLPSFAAQYLLLDRISPLIFTSANPSNMPMIKDDEEMLLFAAEQFFKLSRAGNPAPASAAISAGSETSDKTAKSGQGAAYENLSPPAFQGFHNIKGDQIISDKDAAISGILYNDRKIRVRADDSVARVIDNQPQMIRRSKGYAPVPLYIESGGKDKASIFAAGSQLKNSFALSKGSFAYVSQFFGDMDTVENQTIYEKSFDKLKELFRITPDCVACDMHPLYYTTGFAGRYAKNMELPLIRVQHHHAHIASVMAEHNVKDPVIGVSFDGTGYGTDGNIWGGEFMICEGAEMQRFAHLKYIDMIGGDSSMKDAVRSALSYIAAYTGSDIYNKNKYKDLADNPDKLEIAIDISDIISFGADRLTSLPEANLVLNAISTGINTIRSSSMGRLFDAVASLLGICDYNDYEGKCAILLEDAAAFAARYPGRNSQRLGSSEACRLALAFHDRIIDMILQQCEKIRSIYPDLNKVALSGGTFQNRILMEGTLAGLRKHGFEPYYNISVSPNDGGIALGQMYVAMNHA